MANRTKILNNLVIFLRAESLKKSKCGCADIGYFVLDLGFMRNRTLFFVFHLDIIIPFYYNIINYKSQVRKIKIKKKE